MANDDAGMSVQTKIHGRPGPVIKTGGPVGGGMSEPATDGGIGYTKADPYLRTEKGGRKPLEPTKPAGGANTGEVGATSVTGDTPADQDTNDDE